MVKVSEAFESYKKLLQKVDEKFRAIQSKFAKDMQCNKGCHQCCVPDIRVMRIEKENIKVYLQKNPDLLAKLQQLASENPFKGARCSFLAKDGSCMIYPVRPVVCRSHGAPIKISLDDIASDVTDVCPLNFKGKNINNLAEQDLIRLNTLNTILAAVNEQYAAAAQVDSAAPNAKKNDAPPRFDLKINEIMK